MVLILKSERYANTNDVYSIDDTFLIFHLLIRLHTYSNRSFQMMKTYLNKQVIV